MKKQLLAYLERIVLGVIKGAAQVPVAVRLYVGSLEITINVPVEVLPGDPPPETVR